ncbi:WDR6 family WD repeat protein [Schizosaccharomyces cryophilus OY26]|uniref:WDR6 family WD repeat protein n=1 Tax=Schizosaccharomyces cryophilus (strain OY26 / ATCC MYA-4695 / CBS 11777 / NBRC 106824 / NRRL Y48691) TaxID=653667 RepID=S9VN48_SCHCR|nr:WDR6 family WD repeat protein [Schizosaccharomyces cryophilus OY26]EPY49353.1 WDR6 family WD repeat protein [Schizosaccharomyces cryophilus OY26]
MPSAETATQVCLNSVNFLGPVTSLLLFDHDKYLCAAQGSFLRIYNLDSHNDVNICWKVLKLPFRNRIHGMLACRDGLLIWGGYNIGLVDWKTWEISFIRTTDWIFNAVELNTERDFAFVTSKNEVLIYSYLLNKNWKLSCTISCRNSPLLFFAALHLADDCITVASASAFGEINLWSFSINNPPNVVFTFDSLSGHEGACFDIRFSDDGQYLSTVSEDRTVRLWELKKQNRLLATGFGHTARVWKCRFLSNSSLVTISEDLTLRKWVYDGVKLDNTETFTGHRGKHVWSIATSKKHDLLFTGGNDGAIRQWQVNNDTDTYSFYISSIFTGDVSLSSFCFLSVNKLLCLAKNGEISLLDNKIWKPMPAFSLDSEASALCSWENMKLAALGTKTGSLVIFDYDNPSACFAKKVHTSKIQHLYTAYHKGFYYLVSKSFIGRNAYEVYLHQLSIENGSIIMNMSLMLNLPATFDPTCLTISNDLAFIGSRSGSLAIYKIGQPTCLYCFRRLHEFDTIYSIIIEIDIENIMNLKTVGRDGLVNMFLLKLNPVELRKIASEKAIEGILSGGIQFGYPEVNKNLWVWGFHASNFFLRNETTGTDVYTLECGGSHRPWSFSMNQTRQAFAFYKSNQIFVNDSYRNLLECNKVLRKGSHGREIRAMSFNPEGTLIVSGAEDTNIILSLFTKEGQINTLNSVKVHNSGIQALCWAKDELLFSSGGLEELNALRIVQGPGKKSSAARILHEATCAKTLTKSKMDGDLRITDVSTIKATSWGKDIWLITAILSDSSSRIYLYDEGKRDFQFLKGWDYKSCCLVSVELFVFKNRVYSVITATDGFITLWDLHSQDVEKTPQCVWSSRVHQSCIKSLDVRFNNQNRKVSLFTGGDDGAVCHMALKLNIDTEMKTVYVEELEKFSLPEAHASSVTGILQLEENLFLSASVDQRILTWAKREGLWKVESENNTFVADVGGMFSQGSNLVVFGVGYEVFKINKLL